jgi:hypothetical protein
MKIGVNERYIVMKAFGKYFRLLKSDPVPYKQTCIVNITGLCEISGSSFARIVLVHARFMNDGPHHCLSLAKLTYQKTILPVHTFCNEGNTKCSRQNRRQAMFYHVICVSCWPVLGKETIYKRISPHWLTISKHPSVPSWMSPVFYCWNVSSMQFLREFARPLHCKSEYTSVMQTNTGISTWGPHTVPQNELPKLLAHEVNAFFAWNTPRLFICLSVSVFTVLN